MTMKKTAGHNNAEAPLFSDILETRMQRRTLLRTGFGLGVLPLASATGLLAAESTQAASLGFHELPLGLDDRFHLAEGYRHQVLLRWGDPLFVDAPALDIHAQSGASQARQFASCHYLWAAMPRRMACWW
jgi:uncharacterized protein